jgi:fumarate reductase subunit D
VNDKLDLYVVAAQVIPLLFGFLAFEARSFAIDESARESGARATLASVLGAVIVLVLLFFGEFTALYALAHGRGSPAASTAVSTALFGGGLMLMLAIIQAALRPLAREHPGALRTLSSAGVVIGVALWLLLF